MEQRISLITLAVDDLQQTSRFFEDGLGWTQAPGGNEHIAFYQLNGSALALYSRAHLAKDLDRALAADTIGGMTIAFNARSEEEVDSVYAEALAAGAEATVRPEKVFWGGYSGYVTIPGGHLLEIAYNPFWPLDEKGGITLPSAG
ncbi:VOC family protein [Roseibium suaedae]|uniref:VOC domain-containing protein n=1 Tax=Roseibium suaedae TaxID=735517 RepID=A0A1M7C3B8_9HYPH|nr:VOC family protein [Roseibium suaedae]SHL61339.1 hypothetical protein SAMN05444272_1046 [Roseibium suaedae]